MAASCPIQEILDRVDRDALGLVQAADLLEEAFAAKGLMYTMDINPRQVGFDPANRHGGGGNAQEVHLLAADIAFIGWSWPATAHATCVEAKPGDATLEQFNKALADNVALAPVEPHSLHFGSLACGHTNMVLRCLQASVPSDDPLLSENGKMSLSKLERRDPEFFGGAARPPLEGPSLEHP